MNRPINIADLITTAGDDKFAQVGRIATAIFEVRETKEHCTPCDLIVEGLAPEKVTEHWDMAHALATVEINLMSQKAH